MGKEAQEGTTQGNTLRLNGKKLNAKNINEENKPQGDLCVLKLLKRYMGDKSFVVMDQFNKYVTTLIHMLIFNDRQIKALYSDENMPTNGFLIYGARGTGKSTLLNKVCDTLNHENLSNYISNNNLVEDIDVKKSAFEDIKNSINFTKIINSAIVFPPKDQNGNIDFTKIINSAIEFPPKDQNGDKDNKWNVFWERVFLECINEKWGANLTSLDNLNGDNGSELQKCYLFVDIDEIIKFFWDNGGIRDILEFKECFKNLINVLGCFHDKFRGLQCGGVLACIRKEILKVLDIKVGYKKTNLSDIWDKNYLEYIEGLLNAITSDYKNNKKTGQECSKKCKYCCPSSLLIGEEPKGVIATSLLKNVINSDRRPRLFIDPCAKITFGNNKNGCNLIKFDEKVKSEYKQNYIDNCLDVFPYTVLDIWKSKDSWEKYKGKIIKLVEDFIKLNSLTTQNTSNWGNALNDYIQKNNPLTIIRDQFPHSTINGGRKKGKYLKALPEKIINYFIDVRILVPAGSGEFAKLRDQNHINDNVTYSISNFLKYIYLDHEMFNWNVKIEGDKLTKELISEYEN